MKIDSSLNGFQYSNRAQATERREKDASQEEAAASMRSPQALTGSSTLLSASLANALWVVDSGETGHAEPVSAARSQVEDFYREFA